MKKIPLIGLSCAMPFLLTCSHRSSFTKIIVLEAAPPPSIKKICIGSTNFYADRNFSKPISGPPYLNESEKIIRSWIKESLTKKGFELVDSNNPAEKYQLHFDIHILLSIFYPTLFLKTRVYYKDKLLFEILAGTSSASYKEKDINETGKNLLDELIEIFVQKTKNTS